jgi:hypothetical protein
MRDLFCLTTWTFELPPSVPELYRLGIWNASLYEER